MMTRNILIATLICVLMPLFLFGKVTYLSDEEYKKLSKKERIVYCSNLEAELLALQSEKANVVSQTQKYKKDIDSLNTVLKNTKEAYKTSMTQLLKKLELADVDTTVLNREIGNVDSKLAYYQKKLDDWNKLSDSELWEYSKALVEMAEDFNKYKESSNVSQLPQFKAQIGDIEKKILTLKQAIKPEETSAPKGDTYKVAKGDYLSKISGYDSIYGDPSKWGIIYRANRDVIKDPNVVEIDQVLNIPRGLPTTWKVYRGESLWKIAAYPEVYGKGAKWTLIYRANKDQIKDPNVLKINQILKLPRD